LLIIIRWRGMFVVLFFVGVGFRIILHIVLLFLFILLRLFYIIWIHLYKNLIF